VAIDTPSHGKRGILVHDLHFFYRPMTFFTCNFSDFDVLSVIEINKIR
jgi:hypothetical protein